VESDSDTCAATKDKLVTTNLHDGTSTASTDTPRGDHDITWTHADDAWWPQEAAWSWDCPEVHQSIDYECELRADETLIGPDGELYEVFYPSDIMPGACIEQETHLDSQLHGQVAASSCSCPNSAQTSAEIGISSILAYMRGVAVVRYPAKARLFETVQTATTIALGDHFQRFALVGSTALRIDTPDSDIDAVVFTQHGTSVTGEEHAAPPATQILTQVAKTLRACDPSLRLQLVDCTRVPVLTVFTGDDLSLDLTVDQPLSECHVLWLQSQRRDPATDASFMREVPVPTLDGWEQGLEAAALRCVKWWLRRRHIPVAKEGGYPTVVWTLMVMHVLRCSVFYNEADDSNQGRPIADERTLLGAIATFFDRFTEGGLVGTLLFAEGKQAEFWPQPLPTDRLPVLSGESFSVLDPSTTSQDLAAFGIMPVELAPRISSATHLLHAYELCRGQQLSQQALCGEDPQSSNDGGVALSALFSEASEQVYLLPAYVPAEPVGVMFLCEGALVFGILQRINLKHGWGASFLNRRDAQSSLAVTICDVDVETHSVAPRFDLCQQWLHPCDVVCMASISRCDESCHWDCQESLIFNIDIESLERWCKMQALLHMETSSPCTVAAPRKAPRGKKYERNRRHGKGARI